MKKAKALAAVLAAVLALAGCSADNEAPGSTDASGSSGGAESISGFGSGDDESEPEDEIAPSIKPHGDKTIHAPVTESTSSTESVPESTSESIPDESSDPAPGWTEEPMEAVMYVIEDGAYSRVKPVPGAETVMTYAMNAEINVVAKTDTDYYKLDDGSFIHVDYVDDTMPQ